MTENPVDDLVDAVPNVNLGELLTRAVVQSFFQPTLTGMSQAVDGAGQPHFTPMFGASPLTQLVGRLSDQYGQQIRDAVITGLDLDDLSTRVADKVAERMIDELNKAEPTPRYGYRTAANVSAETINTEVRKKIAERLSEREMAAYDARQQAMQDAWERDQQRQREERERGQLESGEVTGS